VSYDLYDKNLIFISTSTPSRVEDVVVFNAALISSPGTYFIKCIVEKENISLNEEFTIPFIKQ